MSRDMRARLLIWVCVGLNVILAVMVILLARDFHRQASTSKLAAASTPQPAKVKTNIVVRRQHFNWSEVEASDYETYIRNLRRIGCPEKTIRDIIVADVTELYAARILNGLTLPERSWWLPEPDLAAYRAGLDQIRTLEAEKALLLDRLLGPDWNKGSLASVSAEALQSRLQNLLRFDGPVLGSLPAETKARIEQIEAGAARARARLLEQAREEGRAANIAELYQLEQQTRNQLAGLMTPGQFEEYLLRYSRTAEEMREQLRGFGTDADEFRRIFQARDPYEKRIAELTASGTATPDAIANLERMRNQAISQAVGPERYALYEMTENPLFRTAQAQAQQNGAPPEKVVPLFEVHRATQAELARVQNDPALSEDERRVLSATIEQQQQNSINRILANAAAEPVVQPEPEVGPQPPSFPPLPPGIYVVQ